MKSVFYSLLGGALIVVLSAGNTQAATVSVSSLSTTSVAAGNSNWVSKSEKKKRLRSNARRLRKMRRQRY
ncbi:hypothetical protein PK28_02855 [Hymenobacter sp. DG25B]|uniref:hypothetical protein n=1 Tax=Hymenobacter sp. DG25B TaxID=1385664 RepID=UPI000540EB7B|nr:hypothetical protein [Hymenobacter sp. DG25B]AIZ62890.1 hypothetical protein PK28_02855 [Hymenobacter sp. DG25B]